ncbi:MAG: hypothetical protein OEZ38_04355 [Gammaproteobacteria bacterium]|nr:hypothetical protein [Gammaproteobacteria bacterium]
MENDIYSVLQSEVEIAKCIKYQNLLIEKTIRQLTVEGKSDFAEMIARARALDCSSLYYFDMQPDQFEYFKLAVIRVLHDRQLDYFRSDPAG